MTQDFNKYAASLYDENKRDEETLAFLGGGAFVRKLRIPQPSPGVFALLEIVDSPFLQGVPAEAVTLENLYTALVIMTERENADPQRVNFKKIARKIGKLDAEQALEVVQVIQELFTYSSLGFELLPKTAEASKKGANERVYDAELLAALVSKVHQATGKTDFEIIWRTPLCSIGFYLAQWAKENGVENVGRQIDPGQLLDFIRKKRESAKNEK